MHREPQHPVQGPADDGTAMWELRLFVAGTGLEVDRVVKALEDVCRAHLPNGYSIALVDILQDPEQADAFDIVAAPTLVRESPPPPRRVIGDLSRAREVVRGLGIPAVREG